MLYCLTSLAVQCLFHFTVTTIMIQYYTHVLILGSNLTLLQSKLLKISANTTYGFSMVENHLGKYLLKMVPLFCFFFSFVTGCVPSLLSCACSSSMVKWNGVLPLSIFASKTGSSESMVRQVPLSEEIQCNGCACAFSDVIAPTPVHTELQKRANRANLLVLIFPGRC